MGNNPCLPDCRDKRQLAQLSNNIKYKTTECSIEEWREYGFPLYYVKETSVIREDIERIQDVYKSFAELNCQFLIFPYIPIQKTTKERKKFISLKIIEENRIFKNKYSIQVYFPLYQFSLQNFLDENKITSPLPTEIQLLNLISNITVALLICEKEQVPHLNISPDNIFLEQQGFWKLVCPTPWRNTLKIETEQNQKRYGYLIPKEIESVNDYRDILKRQDWIKSDIYSLGILIIYCAFPFNQSQQLKVLSEKKIKEKISLLKQYYSLEFCQLIEKMTNYQPQYRVNCIELIALINKIKFC